MATLLSQGKDWAKYSLTAVDASGSNSSEALDVLSYDILSIQCVHASHDDTSTWKIQVSNDGTNYDDYTNATATTTSTSGSTSIDIDPFPYHYVRITVSETDANSSATLTPYVVIKRRS